jgi:hypothetical protein
MSVIFSFSLKSPILQEVVRASMAPFTRKNDVSRKGRGTRMRAVSIRFVYFARRLAWPDVLGVRLRYAHFLIKR